MADQVVGWVAGQAVPAPALDAYISELARSKVGVRVGVDAMPEGADAAPDPLGDGEVEARSKSAAVRAWAAKGLLADRLLEAEAARLGVGEPGSPEAWAGALLASGEIRLEAPSHHEALACYRANQHRYRTAEARWVRHLVVAEKRTADGLASDILASGTSAEAALARLAGQWSLDDGTRGRGGELGWVVRGQFAGAFEELAFAALPGELCGPVETSFGWHLLVVESVRPARLRPFDECREEILAELAEDRRRVALRCWWGRRLAEAVRVPVGAEHPLCPGLPGSAHRH